ncbi:MAG: hypothetical protein N3D78_03120 [Candidatus Aenigmarchaeota archaeon]|nr:hypothetical protein [Candidatus Aenigmarchaeota archaeon]
MANITLYPSNWLYNAGVIGFLKVLEMCGEKVESFLKDDGSVEIDKSEFEKYIKDRVSVDTVQGQNFSIPKILCEYLVVSFDKLSKEKKSDNQKQENKLIKEVWGKLFNTYYRGFFNGNTTYLYTRPEKGSEPLIHQFSSFVENMLTKNSTNTWCSLCNSSNYNFSYKNKFTSEHNRILGASVKEVPNSFWNLAKETSLNVCDFCSFILLHYHIPLVKLPDNSEIFINAPSFKIMWYLNKYAETLLEKLERKEIKQILGLSIIEMSRKIYVQLGRWEKMNIEVVIKYREKKEGEPEDKIDFFSLPSDVVDILSDREIANVLSQINEFKVLELILDEKFREVLSFGERVFRIGVKQGEKKQISGNLEDNFIENNVRLEKNRKNLIEFAQKLFKLYALIDSKLKREVIV